MPGGKGGTSAYRGSVHPHRHLNAKKLYVLCRVVVPDTYRVSFAVGPAARVDHVEDRVGLTEVVEELVPQALALVGIGNKPRDIDEVDGNERDTVNTVAAGEVKAMAGAGRAHIRDAEVGIDGRKWVVGDLCIRHGSRLEKGRLSAVWFTCKREGDHRISSLSRVPGINRNRCTGSVEVFSLSMNRI